MKYLQVKLEDALHKKFKVKCANQDIDMSSLIRKFIKEFVLKK